MSLIVLVRVVFVEIERSPGALRKSKFGDKDEGVRFKKDVVDVDFVVEDSFALKITHRPRESHHQNQLLVLLKFKILPEGGQFAGILDYLIAQLPLLNLFEDDLLDRHEVDEETVSA